MEIGGRWIRALEVPGPTTWRPPDPVYDDQGGIEGAATTVRDGDLTFSADEAGAPLRVVEDGASMSAHWTRAGPDSSPQPWVCLPFSRVA